MRKVTIPQEAQIAMDISMRELAKYQNNIDPAHRESHTKRVFNLCQEILGYHDEADAVVVLVAAAFHDIGRTRKQDKHAIRSAEIVKKHLEENEILKGLNDSTKELIIEIIKNHSAQDFEVDPRIKEKIEFKILVDADRIDGFGPIGIIRTSLDERFQKSAEDQLKHIRDMCNPDDYKLNSRGGQIVGNKYKTYLCEFEKIYKEQENIGD